MRLDFPYLRERVSFWRGRVEMSLKERGVRGTTERALYYAWLYFTPGGLRERHFDSRFGVHTSGVIRLHELGLTAADLRHTTEYSTTPVRPFMHIAASLHIDHREWVFVDIGAGKGKVMLLACLFPFKQVIGVEYAPVLARIAEENIRTYKNPSRRCSDLVVLCQDALQYSFPIEKSVIFLNNPFSGPVLERFIENLGISLREHPRDLYLIYWNPFCADLFDRAPFLTNAINAPQYRIYGSCVSQTNFDRVPSSKFCAPT